MSVDVEYFVPDNNHVFEKVTSGLINKIVTKDLPKCMAEVHAQEECEHIYGLEDTSYEGLDVILEPLTGVECLYQDEPFTYCPRCGKRLV